MMSLLESLVSPGTIERLGWMLVHVSWEAVAVAALLAVVLRLLGRAGASVRYAVACAALGLMLALPAVTLHFLSAPGPVAEAGPPPAPVVLPPPEMPPQMALVAVTGEMPAVVEAPAPLPATAPPRAVPLREQIVATLEPALPYVVLGWLVGVCGLSAWHLGGWTRLYRLKRRLVREIGGPLQRTLAELGTRLGVRRAVGLLESARVEVPTVVGWLRPVILLPASALTGLSPAQLEAILAHELAHIRRHDYLVNLLQTVVEILGFYHPAVWWVSHRIRIERENCCDDLAVQVCGNSLQYARALAGMEEIRHRRADLAVAATGGSLLARIARLLGRPVVEDRRFAWLPGLITLLLVAGVVIPAALVLATPQRLPTSELPATPVAEATQNATDPNAAPGDADSGSIPADGAEVQILLDFRIVKVRDDLRLDRETMLLLASALGAESRFTREFTQSGGKLDLPVDEILRRYIVPEPLSSDAAEAMLSLLQSHGYLDVSAKPRVLTNDGNRAQVRIIAEERFLPPSDPSAEPVKMECGTAVTVTPHVLDAQRVNLEVMVEISERVPGSDPNQPAVARTSAETSVIATHDRYLVWAAIAPTAAPAGPEADERSVYVLVKPQHINLPPQGLAAAPGRPQAADRVGRQVLLEVRTVTVEGENLGNLGIEWNRPTIAAGGPPSALGGGQPYGVQIGYTPDRTFTNSLLATLDRLRENRRATVSSQQILAQEGRPSRIKAVTEERFRQPLPPAQGATETRSEYGKIEVGTILAVTPRITDGNDLMVEIDLDTSNRVPMEGGGAALPILSRRTTKNTVTVHDGGTVALAGMTAPAHGPNSKTAYETAIFVTAHLLPEPGTASVQVPPSAETALQPPSRAWYVMRQWNCPPLLLGLTQQLAKVLAPSRREDSVRREAPNGGTLQLTLDVEGDLAGDTVVGLFRDARWSGEPVAVRRLRAGTHTLTGLPAGQYQIGAMLGEAPLPLALGVHGTWPEPVEIRPNQTATAAVLVSEAFQEHASGWYNEQVANDYLGAWSDLDENNLLQGRLTGPDGRPIPFGEIMIREHRTDDRGFAAPNRGTNEQGLYKFDEMAWPYRVMASWRESLPSLLGCRIQTVFLNRILEGVQRVDFRFEAFPEGTAKLTGRVQDQNSRPVQGFFLRVMTDAGAKNEALAKAWDQPDQKSYTDTRYEVPFLAQDGSFELGGLPAGAVRVQVIPFEGRRYDHADLKEATLTASQTTSLDFQLVGKNVYYGRILFKEGAPAVVRPTPWRGAVTRIQLTMGFRATTLGEVDSQGYFTLYLDDSQRRALAAGSSRLLISVPTDQEHRWDTVGTFPIEKLAEDKDKAGVVIVKRPQPTPTLPAELRQGDPLPPGWRLEHHRPDGELRGPALKMQIEVEHVQEDVRGVPEATTRRPPKRPAGVPPPSPLVPVKR